MGEDPREIREEIEATRDQMSQTADALAYKTDVRTRAKEKATARKDAIVARVRGAVPANRAQAFEQASATKDLLIGKARGAAQNPGQARNQATDAIKGNPTLTAAAGALAVVLGLRGIRRVRRPVVVPVNARVVNARAQRTVILQLPQGGGKRTARNPSRPRPPAATRHPGGGLRRLGSVWVARQKAVQHLAMPKIRTPRTQRSRRRPMDTVVIGTAGLKGWRAKVADAVAKPVSKKTSLSDDQVRAVIGITFFALSLSYVTGTVKRLAARR